MRLLRRAALSTSRLGVLPGTFNPITVAHLALARSALAHVDEVLFVLPEILPHKHYTGASFPERIEMLQAATAGEPRWSVATAEGGLFVEIAEECRAAYGVDIRLSFLCGRDAAERIAGWDYSRPGAFEEMLGGFDLLVEPRQGAWTPETGHPRIQELAIETGHDHVSASEVRRRIASGEPWEHLVPEPVREAARRIYAR